MDFSVEQRFAADPSTVIALFTNEHFLGSQQGTEKIGPPTLLERTEDSGIITLHIRYKFTAELPDAAARFVDADKMTWVEVTITDVAARRATTELQPDHYAGLLQASGSITYTDDASTPGGTVRMVRGAVDVGVPLFGGRVERAIIEGLEEHLTEERTVAAAQLGG